MNKPHLIMIAADQLRYDVLGKGWTPHIDALAAESVRFENAYCANPLCVPARGSLFTGLCPNTTGSLINPWEKADRDAGYVKEGIDNLYLMMERGGWECLHSGKQHLFTADGGLEERPGIKWLATEKTYREYLEANGRRRPGGPSFRSPVPEIRSRKHTISTTCSNANTGCYEEGEAYYFDRYFISEMIKGLKTRDLTKPLFLSAMFLAPHPPLDVPQPWYSKYSLDDFELPKNVGNWYPHQSPLQLYNVSGALGGHYDKAQWAESWRTYLGLVSLLDDCVGQLIAELKEQGIYDDCLIVFTSDHGEMLGSHRLFQKMCMYQESVKVPLYFRLPKANAVGRVKQNVSHIDVLPTLCHYLGLEPTHLMEGRSLHAAIEGIGSWDEAPIFIQYDGNSCLSGYQRAVIFEEFKLIMDVFQNETYFELYNISHDEEETVNLLFEQFPPRIAFHLFALLLEHMAQTGDALSCPSHALKEFRLSIPAENGNCA